MLHIYCGDGKGKTSAAAGLAVRALGSGWRVCLAQFLKGRESGEIELLRTLPGMTVLREHNLDKFTFQIDQAERAAALKAHNETLSQALELLEQGRVELVVLDEILGALSTELADPVLVKRFAALSAGRRAPEVALTGRNPPDFLLEAADYITEMNCRRHPYQKGIVARKGVEF